MGGLGQAWLNRLPGTRHDDSFYEFAGLTVVECAGGGQLSLQENISNREQVVPVLKEWAPAR